MRLSAANAFGRFQGSSPILKVLRFQEKHILTDKLTSAWSSPNSTRILHNKKLILALWRVVAPRRECAPTACQSKRCWFMNQLSQPQTKKPPARGGFRMENRWIFAYGEYLSACHRFASERLLCAEDAHQPAYKAELVYESTDLCQHKGHPRGVPF